MEFSYTTDPLPTMNEVEALYTSVGWSAYLADLDTTYRGICQSSHVVTARKAGVLVGLARVVSDGATIAYLQDILVDPAYQRCGVGAELFRLAWQPYRQVRQKVLLTDNEPQQRAFYEAQGFTEIRDLSHETRPFVHFTTP